MTVLRREGRSLVSRVEKALAEIGLPRSTLYAWYERYLEGDRRRSKTERYAPGLSGTGSRIECDATWVW